MLYRYYNILMLKLIRQKCIEQLYVFKNKFNYIYLIPMYEILKLKKYVV